MMTAIGCNLLNAGKYTYEIKGNNEYSDAVYDVS